MRLETPLTLIVIALIVLGGLLVDEYNIRSDYNDMQTQYSQMQENLQAAAEQARQLTDQLQNAQAQVAQCGSENADLTQSVADLQSENERLQSENNRLQTENDLLRSTSRVNSRVVGSSLVGVLGLGTIYGGVWTARRLTLHRRSASRTNVADPQSSYVRLSDEEIQSLIQQRRRQG